MKLLAIGHPRPRAEAGQIARLACGEMRALADAFAVLAGRPPT